VISPYVYLIALSQTDTIEQARWMRAMNARKEGEGRRWSNDVVNQQGGQNMKVLDTYRTALENSDARLLNEVFAPQVRIEIPAGATLDHPRNTASHIMSQVAKTAPGIRGTLTADAGSDWYLLGFEGEIEGQKLQAVDQVHLNNDGKIDRLIIYMRPIPVAQKFAEAITQRLQPTT